MTADPKFEGHIQYAEAVGPPPDSAENSERPRQGYPLVSLFILVALCAILLGMATPLGFEVHHGTVGAAEVIVASFLGAVILGVLGTIVGIYHHRRLHGVFLGGVVGAMLGLVCGPMFFISRGSFTQVLLTSLGGSALLLIVGVVIRLNSQKRHVPVGPRAPKPHPLDD
jgi:hypothetical protein